MRFLKRRVVKVRAVKHLHQSARSEAARQRQARLEAEASRQQAREAAEREREAQAEAARQAEAEAEAQAAREAEAARLSSASQRQKRAATMASVAKKATFWPVVGSSAVSRNPTAIRPSRAKKAVGVAARFPSAMRSPMMTSAAAHSPLCAVRANAKSSAREGLDKNQRIVRDVTVPETITLRELANRMAERQADVTRALMKMGVMATASQTIDAGYGRAYRRGVRPPHRAGR